MCLESLSAASQRNVTDAIMHVNAIAFVIAVLDGNPELFQMQCTASSATLLELRGR